MNIYRTTFETSEGPMLAHAEFVETSVVALRVYPIVDGVVREAQPLDMHELPNLTAAIERILTDLNPYESDT